MAPSWWDAAVALNLLLSVRQEHAAWVERDLHADAVRARRDSLSSWGTDLTGAIGNQTAEASAGEGTCKGSDMGARLRAAANASERETRLK